MSIFIQISLDQARVKPEIAAGLINVCPVNIFAASGTGIEIVAENEDECTLCELCLSVAPSGALRIKKLYKDEMLVSHGNDLQ